jgi:transcriptional regulator with XRE-family HTH domain
MSIGKRFKEIRKSLKLNQTELSNEIKLTQSAISQIEKNLISPSSEVLINISQAYKIDINWLLTGKGEMFLSDNKEPQEKRVDNNELINLRRRYDQLEKVCNDLKKSIEESEKECSILSNKNQELNQELFTRLRELLECKDLIIKLQKNNC